MPVRDYSAVTQDYLKVIWAATEWDDNPITVKELAERMGVRPPTASDAIRRLGQQGLVTHRPYGGIELTETGREGAVEMIRRHRLIETFLVEELGYGWDEVHDEAETLEHAVSADLIDRIDRRLGFPERDPHGDPIPTREGAERRPDATPLRGAPTGVLLRIARISDADSAVLRYLESRGLALDTEATLVEYRGFAGDVSLLVNDETVILGSAAAAAIWVALA